MKHISRLSFIALGLSIAGVSAHAVVGPGTSPTGKVLPTPALEVADDPAMARPYRSVQWNSVPPVAARPWARFLAASGGQWQNLWDWDTRVPSRIYGSGIPAPGSMDSPEIAERYALETLTRHIDLLAPGSEVDEFVLVSNHTNGRMRTLGFHQYHDGLRVLGGQVSFRFKADRLFVLGSEALPHVRAPSVRQPLPVDQVLETARAWIATDAEQAWISGGVEGPFILPIVTRSGPVYRTVVRATVEARSPVGRWHVFIDGNTGAPVAREQTLRFGAGTVRYNAPVRRPGDTRRDYDAPNATLTVNGNPATTDAAGTVLWAGGGPASVVTDVTGPLVDVTSDGGSPASDPLSLNDGGVAIWDRSGFEFFDSQITSFIHTGIIKEYAKSFAPNLAFLDQQQMVTVNIDDACNAYSEAPASSSSSRAMAALVRVRPRRVRTLASCPTSSITNSAIRCTSSRSSRASGFPTAASVKVRPIIWLRRSPTTRAWAAVSARPMRRCAR